MPQTPLGALPEEDRERSPFTGWIRAHWERVADILLHGVGQYASPSHSLIFVPNANGAVRRQRSAGLEGFARTFLLAAWRLAGSNGEAPDGQASRYASGLTSGTNPASRERWPAIRNTSQPMLEAAFVALGLHGLIRRPMPSIREGAARTGSSTGVPAI